MGLNNKNQNKKGVSDGWRGSRPYEGLIRKLTLALAAVGQDHVAALALDPLEVALVVVGGVVRAADGAAGPQAGAARPARPARPLAGLQRQLRLAARLLADALLGLREEEESCCCTAEGKGCAECAGLRRAARRAPGWVGSPTAPERAPRGLPCCTRALLEEQATRAATRSRLGLVAGTMPAPGIGCCGWHL